MRKALAMLCDPKLTKTKVANHSAVNWITLLTTLEDLDEGT